MPPSSHHPPALSYWKEQMQMDPKHNTQNTLPRFLGACCKLKLGSSWGLTFSLVQTTSAPHRAWQKVKEPVAAIVDSSEAEESHPTSLSPAQGRVDPHKRPHTSMYMPVHISKNMYSWRSLSYTPAMLVRHTPTAVLCRVCVRFHQPLGLCKHTRTNTCVYLL